MHSSSAAGMPSVSLYGSAERSFRNHSEASEEAAMTRQVLTLADEQRMLSKWAIKTSGPKSAALSLHGSKLVTSSSLTWMPLS